MAHYAFVRMANTTIGIVEDVVVISDEDEDNLDEHLDPADKADGLVLIKCSYNTMAGKHYDPETNQEDDGTPLRFNYPGIGFTYDAVRDGFYETNKPFPSWVLDDETLTWHPPTPPGWEKPTDVVNEDRYNRWEWDEENLRWVPFAEENTD